MNYSINSPVQAAMLDMRAKSDQLMYLVGTLAGARGGADFALALMRKSLRLCSEMSHFCTNLQYYIHFEVMESAWQVGRGA